VRGFYAHGSGIWVGGIAVIIREGVRDEINQISDISDRADMGRRNPAPLRRENPTPTLTKRGWGTRPFEAQGKQCCALRAELGIK
jgi:hypothetical protein